MSLVLIHITDIHVRAGGDNPILGRLEKLKEACASTINPGDTAILAITGDLAYSGKVDEYDSCIEILEAIRSHIKAQANVDASVVLVPGNHDCNFCDDQTIREVLLETVGKTNSVDAHIIDKICDVQKSYRAFEELYGHKANNRISEAVEINAVCGKLLFVLVNTSWMSTIREKPGALYLPIDTLPEVDAGRYDLVITLMHHPFTWLHPDNGVEVMKYLNETTDIVLVGHEHREDEFVVHGRGWSWKQINGSELQSDGALSSSFAVYTFDDLLQTIDSMGFAWSEKDHMYRRSHNRSEQFSRNTHLLEGAMIPNRKTTIQLDDVGAILHHFRVDSPKLSGIYCWPDLEKVVLGEREKLNATEVENVPITIWNESLSFILGNTLSGRTALSKMLYREYYPKGVCCITSNGRDFKSSKANSVQKVIERLFCEQYDADKLERFWQLPKEGKVLFVDDFDNMSLIDETKNDVINYLMTKFSRVVVFCSEEFGSSMALTFQGTEAVNRPAIYKLKRLGHQKRRELIMKWFYLGADKQFDTEIEYRIDSAEKVVDEVLGKHSMLAPSTPLYVLHILQSIDAFAGSSFKGINLAICMRN